WDGQHRHRRRDGPLLVPGSGQHHERHERVSPRVHPPFANHCRGHCHGLGNGGGIHLCRCAVVVGSGDNCRNQIAPQAGRRRKARL
ncbi:uncharacterized protein METZ01_LOCUS387505, partial [marine metagenome]